jgi:hypothetical protein
MKDEGVFMASNSGKELEIIKKDNRLIEARYRVGLQEQRILYAVLGAIRVDDTTFNTYTVDLRELAQLHGITANKDIYKQLHDAAEQLLVTVVDISVGKSIRKTTWLNYVEYVEGEALLKLTIHEKLKPYLLQLKANFTQYQLAAVANFRNSYSIRFYELLKMRQNMGKGGQFYIEYTIVELKSLLGIPVEEYKQIVHLKDRVIKPAMDEINIQTDLKIIDVEYPKKGRAIHAVKITAEPKKQRMLAIQDPEAIRDVTPPEKQPQAVKALVEFGFSESEARALVRTHKGEKVTTSIAFVRAKMGEREIKDPCAYLRTVVKGDGGAGWANEQQEAKEERQKRLFEERKKDQEEAEKQERDRAERRQAQATFEALETDEQESILDAFLDELVASEAGAFVVGEFKSKRAKGEAHKSAMLFSYFKRVMRNHGLI